jgi:hypothetical protein
MMQLLQRILRSARSSLFLLPLLGLLLLFWLPGHQAKACWNIIENNCFIFEPTVPPNWGQNGFQHPSNSGRYWWRYPNPPYDPGSNPPPPGVTWDIENRVFDTHACAENEQAIWCDGWPRTHDPRFDNYPPYDSAYVTYGPIDLSLATAAAMCSFYLYNRTEVGGDSIFWGAVRGTPGNANSKKIHLLPRDSIYISGMNSSIMTNQNFQTVPMDLAHVRRLSTGDTVSLLGSNCVYLFWRFRSNSNTTVNTGAFLDNVTISWDDGGIDLSAGGMTLKKMDSTLWSFPLVPGEDAFATFTFNACAGGSGGYPPFEVVGTVDTTVILDTMISNVEEGGYVTLNTRAWTLQPDTHTVRIFVDSTNTVFETDENNNIALLTYVVPPIHPAPSFFWVTPGDCTGTVYADRSVVLRWESYHDPAVPARLSFYSNLDGHTCTGLGIEGGANIPVRDGPDSLVWDLTSFPYGRVLYPFVLIHDDYNDTCQHAPFPVVRRAEAADNGPENTIPERFFLEQNYPNPFNPTTELRYGLAKSGHVSLTVYDVLGREVAQLVNRDQSPGSYRVEFDGSTLPSGLYLYKLTTPEGTESRKMMLMK